jgi:hypothetical protein
MNKDLTNLAADDLRNYDTSSVLTKADVLDAHDAAVSLRAHYTDDKSILINRQNQVVDSETLPAQSEVLVLLSADSTGQWRYASVEVTTARD